MSQNIVPLKTVKELSPRVNIDNERLWGVYEGGSRVSYKNIISTSVSNNSIQFSAPPPSPGTIVDRRVYIKSRVTFNFTGTSSAIGQRLLNTGLDALRAFPLSQVCETLTATINNTAVSINLSDVVDAFLRYNSEEGLRNGYWSLAPSALDQSQQYSDLFGTNMNPLGSFGDANQNSQMPRGAFQYVSVTNPASTVAVEALSASVTVDITEPLFLSPFYWEQMEKSGFYGVQNLDFNFSYASDITRMWSRNATDSPIALSTISANFVSSELLFCYITPKEIQRLPDSVTYPYYIVNRYPTTI
jgi:hypothetical protein